MGWNCSNPAVLEHIPDELKDTQSLCSIPDSNEYTKTLGIEWNAVMDHFCLTIAEFPAVGDVTKRFLISDVTKTFDVLGWFAPCTVKMKILFQQLWELKLGWDDFVPESVRHDGELSLTYFQQSTYLAATLTNSHPSLKLRFMGSQTHRNWPTQQFSTCAWNAQMVAPKLRWCPPRRRWSQSRGLLFHVWSCVVPISSLSYSIM